MQMNNVCISERCVLPCFFLLQALQAGIVWVNCSQPCFTQAPWGGNKRSGFGRELGEWYILHFKLRLNKFSYIETKIWGLYSESCSRNYSVKHLFGSYNIGLCWNRALKHDFQIKSLAEKCKHWMSRFTDCVFDLLDEQGTWQLSDCKAGYWVCFQWTMGMVQVSF